MEDITDAGYEQIKRVCKLKKGCKIKSLGEYHDLYVQRNTLLLADVLFENFRNMSLENL